MNQISRVLRREMSPGKKTMIGIGIGMGLFYALSIVFCVCVFFATRHIVTEQAVRSITNISQLNQDMVSRAILNRRTLLETLAERFERDGIVETDEILQELSDFGKAYDFYRIGFLTRDQKAYMTDGSVIDIDDSQLPFDAWEKAFHLSPSYPPYSGGEKMVNTFAYPVCFDGEVKYVLFAAYYSVNLTERMNTSAMEGRGHSFLVTCQGEMAIYPRHYEDEEYNALMKHINDTPEIIPNESGDHTFDFNGERYYAHFEELGINNWFLMTCVKESDVYAGARAIITMVFLSIGTLFVIILFVIGYTFYNMRRTRLVRTKEMFYDELLNIPNKKALSVVYNDIPDFLFERLYLVIFDIDKFKEFNYIYGSDAGDELLKYIVRTLTDIEPEVYLFRYMSDYFVVLDTSESREKYEEKVNLVLTRFRCDAEAGVVPPFEISAGVRKLRKGESLQLVISDALVARGTIKGNHMRSYAFYDDAIRKKRLEYMEIESNFAGALRNHEFHVFYQPKVDIRTGEIVGAEALVRWIKPDGTIISPASFIPCLEASGQIMLLDEEMLCQVCCQMKDMEREGLEIKRVSVNLSRVHLRNPGILPKIEAILARFQVDPNKLSFEITETVLYEDSIPLKTIVETLHSFGCKVEMDDYGVGVSGPNSLAHNSFDVVKLDKSLADGLGNERVADVIGSTAQMAKKWGMCVLVEGVETMEQAERLLELGCTYAQGFYYSRPVPENEYRAMLRKKS